MIHISDTLEEITYESNLDKLLSDFVKILKDLSKLLGNTVIQSEMSKLE